MSQNIEENKGCCVPVDQDLRLAWTNAAAYDEITVHRGGDLVGTLQGDATSWIEPLADLETFYRVVARRDGADSPAAICSGEPGVAFLRGDVEPDGTTNLSDAVRILETLFLGGAPVSCLDAADVDDNGRLNINDAIRLLNFLFLGGPPPGAPFPGAGRDWTIDALPCRAE